MNKQNVVTRIKEALEKLDVHGKVRIAEIAPGDTTRLTVYINDEYFGVYDTDKNTFVD